jgi:heme/copper-type cytochrome/quinol oxidase subunit 2
MASKNSTRFAVLFLILAVSSCFAQSLNNASLTCPHLQIEDNGTSPLTITVGVCQFKPFIATAPNAYISQEYYSEIYTLKNSTDVSLTDGRLVSDGLKSGANMTLIVTMPVTGVQKEFELAYNYLPTADAMQRQQWPITLHLPAGATVQVEVYAFSNVASNCSNTCYDSAKWKLQ